MELVYRSETLTLVLALDLEYDLQAAGLLLDTFDNALSEAEVARRSAENGRRVELFGAAYRVSLARIAAQKFLTIFIGDESEATRTPVPGCTEGDTWERRVCQEAHDRTPAETLWS